MQVYFSHLDDPYWNLAIEDWLFREVLEDDPMLLLWRDRPSVIIGRAQNPWLECQVPAIEKQNIPLVRRQSGGGTVYHDLGNLNISVLSSKGGFSKTVNIQTVQAALASLGIATETNQHCDILLPHLGELYKISGSAFRETKDKAFHHMTLLVNSNLNTLKDYLAPGSENISAKGVKSRRSQVANIQDVAPHIGMGEIQTALMQAFGTTNPPITLHTDKVFSTEHIQAMQQTYTSWEWNYGHTLPFTEKHALQYQSQNILVTIHISKGHIEHTEIQPPHGRIEQLLATLIGQRYTPQKFSDPETWLQHFIQLQC